MSNLIGAALGALIDRRDGDSGIKGAIVGGLSQRLLAAAVPIIATIAIGWVVQHYLRSDGGKAAEQPVDAALTLLDDGRPHPSHGV